MIVASGTIPYQYEGIYPYRLPANNPIMAMSGIILEQVMTVLSAEGHRFRGSTSSPQTFNKYINPGTAVVLFTPRPDGANLDGTIDNNPGGAYFMDYIYDMRVALIDQFNDLAFDLNGNGAIAKVDWLLWVGTASGASSLFTRSIYSNAGVITNTDITDLGASGVLFDLDIREVAFQPFSRMGKLQTKTISLNSVSKKAVVALTPFFPNFQNTAGAFVTVNTRDSQYLSLTSSSITRDPADLALGLLVIDGDMFFSSTDFCVTDGTTTRTNLEGAITHNAFSINSLPGRVFSVNADGTVDPRGSALVNPPALAYGGYSIGAINSLSALPGLVVPSGTLSFYPNIPYNGYHCGSGYYVFDNSFWILDGNITFPSGAMLVNPHTGNGIWFRIADQAVTIDQNSAALAFRNAQGFAYDGADVIRTKVTGDTSASANDLRIAFLGYSKSNYDQAYVVNNIEDWSVFGPSDSAPTFAYDIDYDGSQYLVLSDSVGVFRNIYLFDGAFNFVDSKLYTTTSLYWMRNGLFGGGYYGLTAPTEISALTVDPDPTVDTVTQGTVYTVDTSVSEWPAGAGTTMDFIMDARVIDGDANIPAGTWFLAQTTTKVVLFRGTLSGTSIIPDHIYILTLDRIPGISVGGVRYQFYFGPII